MKIQVFGIAAALIMLTTITQPANAQEMRYADSSRGREISKDPTIVFFNDRYWMYYSLPPYANGVVPPEGVPASAWTIGIASSTDLTNWKKEGELLPAGDYEKKGLCAPGARVMNGQVHLFYQTYGNDRNDAICHATSTDGVHFTRNASNPIFHPTGSWTAGRAIDADVFPFGDRLILLFATRDKEYKIQKIGAASAPLNSDFTRDKWQAESIGSVFAPELDWEKACIEAPSVIQHEGKLWMFYAGGYNNEPQQIGIATSKDGITWLRASEEPFLKNGEPGSWNSSESGHPGIFQDPKTGRTWLFFQGNKDRGATWYLSKVEVFWKNGRPSLTP
ncbi:glycoside hydrolase [bacterium]|nr:MAG: glycoside hydrolase [bacterium]